MPYCDELRYTVCSKTRVLHELRCRSEASVARQPRHFQKTAKPFVLSYFSELIFFQLHILSKNIAELC